MAPDPKDMQARLEAFAALGGPLTGEEILGQVYAAFTATSFSRARRRPTR